MIQQLKSQFETIFLSLGGTKEESILQPSNLPHLCDFQIFDIDKFMALEGFTGPYVLYSGVRAKSLLKKVGIKGKSLVHDFSKEERALLIKIQQSSFVFEKALKLNQPHILCEYVYDLASHFSSFYNSTKVMTESNESLKAHYVFVVESFIDTMEKVLSLLGMKLPEKM